MFERRISEENVGDGLKNGIIVEDYPDDTPYPSRLVLGWVGERPIHVVTAYNFQNDEEIVVTVYEPERSQWTADFKRRRK